MLVFNLNSNCGYFCLIRRTQISLKLFKWSILLTNQVMHCLTENMKVLLPNKSFKRLESTHMLWPCLDSRARFSEVLLRFMLFNSCLTRCSSTYYSIQYMPRSAAINSEAAVTEPDECVIM